MQVHEAASAMADPVPIAAASSPIKMISAADEERQSAKRLKTELLQNESSLSEADPLPPIRMINFEHFLTRTEFPRFPDNADLITELSDIDMSDSFIVFISHCWLRGWTGAPGYDGRPHPDNATHAKFALTKEVVHRVWKNFAPAFSRCFVWLDFGCINQNEDPAGELKQLDKIVQVCDCLVTPIYDDQHSDWDYPSNWDNMLLHYQSSNWQDATFGYVNRAWCRVEMMYASNVELQQDNSQRCENFRHGLRTHARAGRRPHFLYGSKESEAPSSFQPFMPHLLPPLQNSHFDSFNPRDGSLSKESDRAKIIELVEACPIKQTEYGYIGERNASGQRHGQGKEVFATGDEYVGEWREDLKHGQGTFVFGSGTVYVGQWQCDQMHGHGVLSDASGSEYEGSFAYGKKHGQGVFCFATGEVYKGDYFEGRREGQGEQTTADGSIFHSGKWEKGKPVTLV